MTHNIPIPIWLRLWFQGALIGEVYPEIRAIAVGLSKEKELTVRYYLDREPNEFDYDSVQSVVSAVLSNTSSDHQIASAREECIYSRDKQSTIERLGGGLVYARREYDG